MKKKIVTEIAEKIISNKDFNNYGLLTGYIGQMIFLFEYANKVDTNYLINVNLYVEQFYNDVEQGIVLSSYSRGISGACLGLAYLNAKNSLSFVSKNIEEYLSSEVDAFLQNDDFDFLHGAIGIGFYFIEKFKEKDNKVAKDTLENILKNIDKKKIIKGDNKITWLNFNNVSDISISHGVSSIIIFLSKLIDVNFPNTVLIKNLLRRATNYVISQQIDFKIYNSYYPYTSDEENLKGSRLAWCYGDLGICMALLKSSEILLDMQLQKSTLDILLYNISRKNLKKNLVEDSAICHGTAGISLIYNILYKKYKLREFYHCEKFWITKTVELYQNEEINDLSLLEGLSGTGLVLLNSQYNTELKWSRFFLI